MKNISKKGFMSTPIWMAIYSLVLIILLWGIFSPSEGKASQIEREADKILSIDKETISSSNAEIVIAKEAEQIYNSLSEAIDSSKNSEKCTVQVDEFPNMKDSTVVLGNVDDGIFMRIIDSQQRIVKSKTIYGIHPCLVAGKEAINFYNLNFKNQKTGNEFLEVSSIIIAEKDSIIANKRTYEIEDNDCCTNNIYTNNKKVNVLYKPDKEHICFIATKDGDWFGNCDADENGLDDDCISDGDIFLRIKKC